MYVNSKTNGAISVVPTHNSIGVYSVQIRLYDDDKWLMMSREPNGAIWNSQGLITIPPLSTISLRIISVEGDFVDLSFSYSDATEEQLVKANYTSDSTQFQSAYGMSCEAYPSISLFEVKRAIINF